MTPPSRLIARLVLRGVAGIVITDAILFGVAGRLDWRAAWVMSGLFAAYVAAGIAWFVRRDPDLMRERITPVEIQALGALGVVASFAVIWWCTAANHYLSSQSRIQTDRGHHVVREGPYAVVRHPMYISLMVLTASIALLLGSWLALIPAAFIGVLLVIRTSLEDRVLRNALAGYREYALDVRQRLVPGVW